MCHYDEMRTKVDCDSLLSLFETKFKTIASILMFRKKRMSLRKQKFEKTKMLIDRNFKLT